MQVKLSTKPVDYDEAVCFMEERVAAIHAGTADEMVWFLEHPPLYTAGTSARDSDLLDARFPVYKTGRGGQYTYHGPGQRVAYVMLDLKKRQSQPDIRRFVWQLEEWIIQTLEALGIKGERREGRVGIWVSDTSAAGKDSENKIAALGVRVRHWVSYHGIAINLNPDLSHFTGIVPCGISGYGTTSVFSETGRSVSMENLDNALVTSWSGVFGDELSGKRN